MRPPGGAGGQIILKRDNENAPNAFKDAVGKLLGGIAILENPPKVESQPNGRIAETVKTITGFVRVMEDKVETEAGITLEVRDSMFQWVSK